MDKEIRELRNIIKQHDNKTKAVEGIQKEVSQRKKRHFWRKASEKKSGRSSLEIPDLDQQKNVHNTETRDLKIEDREQGLILELSNRDRELTGAEKQRYENIETA